MSTKLVKTDVFVRVEVDAPLYAKDDPRFWQRFQERAEEVATSVRRHVDEVTRAYVVTERESQCEHCGARWTEDSDKYNGGCCDADEAGAP